MKKRFTEEQIIKILKEDEADMKAADIVEGTTSRADFLPLEEQIWRHGNPRCQEAQTTRRRKS